jgi:hypothetical protein
MSGLPSAGSCKTNPAFPADFPATPCIAALPSLAILFRLFLQLRKTS